MAQQRQQPGAHVGWACWAGLLGHWWCAIPSLQQLHPLCLLPTRRDGGSGGESSAAAAGGGPLGRGVSFRGDSRWVGLAKAAGQDIVAGMTQSCQLYVAEFECR